MAEAEKKISSVDYLLDNDSSAGQQRIAPPEASSAPPAVLQAFASTQVLLAAHELETAGGGNHGGVLLSEIDDRLKMGALALVPSVRLLVDVGLIEILETRTFDDHRVTVTDEGAALLARERQPELLKRLGAA